MEKFPSIVSIDFEKRIDAVHKIKLTKFKVKVFLWDKYISMSIVYAIVQVVPPLMMVLPLMTMFCEPQSTLRRDTLLPLA